MNNASKGNVVFRDGTCLKGTWFGYPAPASGEVVFNTGMVGYPETLTDPSYRGQILVMTYPLIGNYGVPHTDRENNLLAHFESESIQVSGLIIANYAEQYSHWNAAQSLSEWLYQCKVPALHGVDTRMITKLLRESGSMPGTLTPQGSEALDFTDPNERVLSAEVCVTEPVLYEKGPVKIVVVDCGVKNNIIQAFLRRNISVLRVPYDYDFTTIQADGIVLSNGPGDPAKCLKTIEHTRIALQQSRPILGICLGSQILALAAGATTYKLKYGHRSHNQPVNEAGTRRCFITSQNHGYAIDGSTLPLDWREWFTNDNDGTNEGVIHIAKPFFGAQFHPEASPGPDDTEFIFDMFVRALQ